MREQITRCDVCDEFPAQEFSVCYERYMDAAGDTDTRVVAFDLCAECQKRAFEKSLEEFAFDPALPTIIKKLIGKEPRIFD